MSFSLEYDVVVVGAGSAGCIAALASTRQGARTLLVDRLGFPGGTSTAVLDTFYAFFTAGPEPTKIVSGLPDEPIAALRTRDAVRSRPNSFGSGIGFTYDPEALKRVWAGLLRESGVDLMLHALVVGVETEGSRVAACRIATKAGEGRVQAAAFVDASGDADVVHWAGGPTQPDDDRTQPATTTFRMSPVDVDRFTSEGRPRLRQLVTAARDDGYELPGDGGSLHGSGQHGVVLTALTRTASPDLTDPLDISRVELDGLAQTDEWARFLRDRMPGFERADVVAISPMAGVRETRRILGQGTLTEDAVLRARQVDTQIALCGAPVEDLAADPTRWVHVDGYGAYGIPWETLVPTGLEGIVVAGRCFSATHAAHASARSMATCMALGQAAGTAAAMAAHDRTDVATTDPDRLQAALRSVGATLEMPA